MRDNSYTEIESTLSSLSSPDDLVSGVKEFILGVCANHQTEFQKASEKFQKSLGLLEAYDAKLLQYLARFNYYTCLINLHQVSKAKVILGELAKHECLSIQESLIYWRSSTIMALIEHDLKSAQLYISKMEEHQEDMTESGKANFFYVQFDFFLQKNDLKTANAVLMGMKKHRKFYNSPNYLFMKGLLNFLMDNKTFYFYKKDFLGSPFLWEQISVLQKLEEKDTASAQVHWQKLALLSPDTYLENFTFAGPHCLFKVVLEKLNPSQTSMPVLQAEGMNRDDLLYHLLSSSQTGIRKEELFREVYGRDLNEKNDLNKLKTLVLRVRAKFGVEIVSKKGCYILVTQKAA